LLEHLIHLLTKNDEEKGTNYMQWQEDMPNVFNGTKERLDLVATNVEELKVSVAALEEAMKAEKDEQFIAKMKEFTASTNQRMQMIIDSATKVRDRFTTTSAFYGEDDANDDFISFLGAFHKQFAEQIKQMAIKKEKEESRKKRSRAFMPKAKRDAMAGATDTKFKRQMEDDEGMLFGAKDGSGVGAGAGKKFGISSKVGLKSNSAATSSASRAKPKVVAIQAYVSDEDESSDSVEFDGPLVGVKVASNLPTKDDSDSDDEKNMD